MSYNALNYNEQGGARTVIGGELVITGELIIDGGSITNEGTQAEAVADLTDSSTGTADGTVAEVTDLSTSDTYSDAAVNAKLAIVNNNFADVADKINDILAALRGAGIIAGS